MEYSIEKYEDILDELKPILVPFFKEVDIYPEHPTPNINHEQFIALDEIGSLQVVTARKGELAGFHVAFIMPDIFYKHILTAAVAFYYLLPKYRGGGNGTKMFEFADQSFKDKGVERIFMSRKIYIDNSKLFDKLGYTHIESNYTKYMQ